MFGYIRPAREELKIREYKLYHAAYCGLCRRLGKQYGLAARFFVNYDMTFLYFLLSGVRAQKPLGRCVCPANVLCRKDCIMDDALLDYVADIDVLLCHHKLRDDIADGGFFRAIPGRMAAAMTARAARKAKKRQPQMDALIHGQLCQLAQLECEKSGSLDATADTFATLLKGCAGVYPTPELRRPLEQVLYHVGRFLYLTDALDDLSADVKHDDYNPLRYRFQVENGHLGADDLAYLLHLLDASVSLAGAAYELLPRKSGQGIVENILYMGLPCVLKLVSQGKFRERKKLARPEKV